MAVIMKTAIIVQRYGARTVKKGCDEWLPSFLFECACFAPIGPVLISYTEPLPTDFLLLKYVAFSRNQN